jgi:hypothetical protein
MGSYFVVFADKSSRESVEQILGCLSERYDARLSYLKMRKATRREISEKIAGVMILAQAVADEVVDEAGESLDHLRMRGKVLPLNEARNHVTLTRQENSHISRLASLEVLNESNDCVKTGGRHVAYTVSGSRKCG